MQIFASGEVRALRLPFSRVGKRTLARFLVFGLQINVDYREGSSCCSVAPPEFCRPSPKSPRGDPDIPYVSSQVMPVTVLVSPVMAQQCSPDLFNRGYFPALSLPVLTEQEIRLLGWSKQLVWSMLDFSDQELLYPVVSRFL